MYEPIYQETKMSYIGRRGEGRERAGRGRARREGGEDGEDSEDFGHTDGVGTRVPGLALLTD